jgi:menaquinone-dependent protoporphyrinogen IX oxidase
MQITPVRNMKKIPFFRSNTEIQHILCRKPSAAYTINLSESYNGKGPTTNNSALQVHKTIKNDPNRAVFAYIISTIYQRDRQEQKNG